MLARTPIVFFALSVAGCGLVSGLDGLNVDGGSQASDASDASQGDVVAVDQSTLDAPTVFETGTDGGLSAGTALSSVNACSSSGSADATLLLSGSDFTLELWLEVKANIVTTETDAIVWKGGRTTSEPGWSLDQTSNGIEFCLADAAAAKCTPIYNATMGDLLHVAVISQVSNGREVSLYVRDVTKNEGVHFLRGQVNNVASTWTSSGPFTIGGARPDNQCSGATNVVVDDVRVYNTALSVTQLESDMGTIPCTTAGLVAYFKFDEGSGTTTTDCSSSTKLSLTLVAGASFVPSPFP
jgi:hypothetical protein